jgi:dTDP-4-dehydrorhamnose reductase
MSSVRPVHPLLIERPPILLGSGGMLHRAWASLLNQWQIPGRHLTRKELDLSDPASIDGAIGSDCGVVINCAAYTDVDGAEKDEAKATAVNGTGVGHLARCCRERGALLVHYSTDYVFDGKGTRPYRPDDERRPLGAYGRSKAVGEVLIQESGCEHLILRTSWLYAPWGKNFVRTIARFLKQGNPLKIVGDQTGRPTSSEHLAAATLGLIEKDARGIFHVTDGGQCTWYDFACEIARLTNNNTAIHPITTQELGRPAPRPAYSVMDLAKTEEMIGRRPDWKVTLGDVVARLE